MQKDLYRVLYMTGKHYAIKVDISDEDEQGNIRTFCGEGTPVIMVEDLEDAANLFNIEVSDIEIVK